MVSKYPMAWIGERTLAILVLVDSQDWNCEFAEIEVRFDHAEETGEKASFHFYATLSSFKPNSNPGNTSPPLTL